MSCYFYPMVHLSPPPLSLSLYFLLVPSLSISFLPSLSLLSLPLPLFPLSLPPSPLPPLPPSFLLPPPSLPLPPSFPLLPPSFCSLPPPSLPPSLSPSLLLPPQNTNRCMRDVLIEKYKWHKDEAELFASFLEPMLDYNPSARATAQQCLQHPWVQC